MNQDWTRALIVSALLALTGCSSVAGEQSPARQDAGLTGDAQPGGDGATACARPADCPACTTCQDRLCLPDCQRPGDCGPAQTCSAEGCCVPEQDQDAAVADAQLPADGGGTDGGGDPVEEYGTISAVEVALAKEELRTALAARQWPAPSAAVRHHLPYAAGVHMGISQGTRCGDHARNSGSVDFNVAGEGGRYESTHGLQAVASAPGTVVVVHRGSAGYGNYVAVRHLDGTQSLYAHLQDGSLQVAVDDVVCRGQALGTIGSSGTSTGDHLHFELRGADTRLDPSFAELAVVPAGCGPCSTTDHTAGCYRSTNSLQCEEPVLVAPTLVAPVDRADFLEGSPVRFQIERAEGVNSLKVTRDSPDPQVVHQQPLEGAEQVLEGLPVGEYRWTALVERADCPAGVCAAAERRFTIHPRGCGAEACDAGSRRCTAQGGVERCDADGCGWLPLQDCTCGCHAGQCDQPRCDPGTRRCSNLGDQETCAADGCGWSRTEDCACDCADGVCQDCCEADDFWTPTSMSAAALNESNHVTLTAEIRSADLDGELDIRLCTSGDQFYNQIHVFFEDWLAHMGLVAFDGVLDGVGHVCTPWGPLDHSWDSGERIGGPIRVISPASCADAWDASSGGTCQQAPSPGCGACWYIDTSIMQRTCLGQ